MNRSELQQIAQLRLKEVEVLLAKRKYSGAYYLSGYVIECALKACIAKKTRKSDFPDLKTVQNSYTHDLEKLMRTASLEAEFKQKRGNDSDFADNWRVTIEWSEASRYEIHGKQKAEAMYEAIVDRNHGVLQWIEQYW
ncbi:MAG: HEPN domain-containing protein [Cyanobacteriota bacterium]|nr:HEPN domain-containing protein [Cyanobacteriota bacterium]